MSSLTPLIELIVQNARVLEAACASGNGTGQASLPDLNAPFDPASEAFRKDPKAAEAANLIAAAAFQLAATVLPPPSTLLGVAEAFLKPAALRVAVEAGVVEMLREAGQEGMHVNNMAKLNGLDPQKLARFLRLLASNFIFREVAPDVFANNRISSMIDTGKSSKEILADPEHKYDGTKGISALCAFMTDEPYKAAAHAWETVSDPADGRSGEPDATAMARAFGVRESVWKIMTRPENAQRLRRFNIAMAGSADLQPANVVLGAFDWVSLPTGALVVDVGGGIGKSARAIVESSPLVKVVVQDLPEVVEDGKKWWSENNPKAVESGQVVLESHSFFEPQTPRDVSVFLLKQILHDWSDPYCAKILTHLRTAATPGKTKLVIMDSCLSLACREPLDAQFKDIPGALPHEAPEPLLPNYGPANDSGYLQDLVMLLSFNSQERNLRQFDTLLRGAGWKITFVRRTPGLLTNSVEAVPL
ncbi:O-methyltransferase-domain-containing protein [Schizophyllum commune]